MPTHTSLKGFDGFGYVGLTEQLKINLVEFFKWGMLGKGAFYNVTMPSSGAYGGDFHRLAPVSIRGKTDGTVWQGVRQDWVWESGIDYGAQPIQVSGVYVDSVFYPISTSGNYSHYVDYPRGQIVFGSGLPTTSVVEAEYSYRQLSFYNSDAPWFREIMFNSMRVDDGHFMQIGSGEWDIPAENRLQLPIVIVEPTARRTYRGKCLGGGQIVNQDVLFHIFAQTEWMRDSILDYISFQNHKTIRLFDNNAMRTDGAYPLHVTQGSILPDAKTYPDLVEASGGYFWRKMTFLNTTGQLIEKNQSVYQAVVRTTIQVDMPNI